MIMGDGLSVKELIAQHNKVSPFLIQNAVVYEKEGQTFVKFSMGWATGSTTEYDEPLSKFIATTTKYTKKYGGTL